MSLGSLNKEHAQSVRLALANVLSTKLAELTYGQILDGLPTEQSLRDSFTYMKGHPVYELKHDRLCDGVVERVRQFRSDFEPSTLRFQDALMHAFQATRPGTREFNLRLVEAVVVACHQIAAALYQLDGGVHKHRVHQDWVEEARQQELLGVRRHYPLMPTAFFHPTYRYHEQYPRGVADLVGYWAEGKIFGGVVVFDRGESDQECNEMLLRDGRIRGPNTLYPLTPDQFEGLVGFLLATSDPRPPCPLPIHGTDLNRPRWDVLRAFTYFHIFRDRYELKLPEPADQSRQDWCLRQNPLDWPELGDQWFLAEQAQAHYRGEPVDEEAVAAASERLGQVTPTSPLWRSSENRGGEAEGPSAV